MSETVHAKTCSPSGAEGWFACAGRIVMEAEFPDKDTDYSSDGTCRHSVGAACLESSGSHGAASFVGLDIDVNGKTVTYKPEWVEEDQDYVDTVRALANGGELFVERRVNFEAYTGVPGDSFGTADAIVLRPFQMVRGDDEIAVPDHVYELIIVDRKTGYVTVDPERNKQLMLYALGALAEFGMVYDIARVRLVIHQRTAREWDCSIDELLAFGEQARAAAAFVQDAINEHGIIQEASWQRIYLNQDPSEDACRYCKAMATCPAMQAKVEQVVGADFSEIVEHGLPYKPAPDLAVAMAATGLLEDFCKSVRAEVERRLLAGKEVPGFGLELGKQGARQWANETEAEKMLREQFRLKVEEAYDLKLVSPTTAEKLHKSGVIGPRQWAKAQALITRSAPKPSVKPISAIKTPYVPPRAEEDFAVIPETQEAAGLDLC